MAQLKVLYFFTSPDYSLIEIKVLGLPKEAAPGDVYKWMVYDHQADVFHQLSFKSMKKDANLEYRSFEEGELSFDLSEAQFQYKNKALILTRQNTDDLDDNLLVSLGKNL